MPPRPALQSVRLAPPRVRGALWRYGYGRFYDILCTCERHEYSFSGACKTLRIFHTFLCLCRGVCKRVGRSKEKIGLRKLKKGPRNFKVCPTFFFAPSNPVWIKRLRKPAVCNKNPRFLCLHFPAPFPRLKTPQLHIYSSQRCCSVL